MLAPALSSPVLLPLMVKARRNRGSGERSRCTGSSSLDRRGGSRPGGKLRVGGFEGEFGSAGKSPASPSSPSPSSSPLSGDAANIADAADDDDDAPGTCAAGAATLRRSRGGGDCGIIGKSSSDAASTAARSSGDSDVMYSFCAAAEPGCGGAGGSRTLGRAPGSVGKDPSSSRLGGAALASSHRTLL